MTTTLPALRDATVADVVTRLQSSTYLRTDMTALGWGMGDAQENIADAVGRAARMGLLIVGGDRGEYVQLTPYGREWTPVPVFTLRYRTSNGPETRVRAATGIEVIGKVLMRLADRDMATDIEVHDEAGQEVTFDFACFS